MSISKFLLNGNQLIYRPQSNRFYMSVDQLILFATNDAKVLEFGENKVWTWLFLKENL